MEAVPPPRPRCIAVTAVEDGHVDKNASVAEKDASLAEATLSPSSSVQDQGLGSGGTQEEGCVVPGAESAAVAPGAWCAQVSPSLRLGLSLFVWHLQAISLRSSMDGWTGLERQTVVGSFWFEILYDMNHIMFYTSHMTVNCCLAIYVQQYDGSMQSLHKPVCVYCCMRFFFFLVGMRSPFYAV